LLPDARVEGPRGLIAEEEFDFHVAGFAAGVGLDGSPRGGQGKGLFFILEDEFSFGDHDFQTPTTFGLTALSTIEPSTVTRRSSPAAFLQLSHCEHQRHPRIGSGDLGRRMAVRPAH